MWGLPAPGTFLVLGFCLSLARAVEHPEDFPNLLAGSFTDGQRFSTGNTLPLIGRPWGFNHWAPQTNAGRSSWWFSGNDHQFRWLRCTHQPSPWIGDYAWFMLGPQMGGATSDPIGFWEPRAAVMKPHLFDATTGPDGMRIELSPTMHGAALRVTFPEFNPGRNDKRICFRLDDGGWGEFAKRGNGAGFLTGSTTRVNGHPREFRMHICATSDEPIDRTESVGRSTACFTYTKTHVFATVRVATSFISQEQCAFNLESELGKARHPGFDSVTREAREEWRQLLKRADVVDPGDLAEDTQRHLTVFYTGLYRALTFPRRLDETKPDGSTVHYSPYADGGPLVRPGPLVTDNGFWDTFRTVYPLLGLLYPDHLGWVVQGWLNAYKEGGWIPGWASPGYRESMVGTYGDVVVADAIVKKIPGFEVATAWHALRKDSYEEEGPGGHKGVGKAGIRHYDAHGFIPNDVGVSEQVSRSLDFAFADVAVAHAAEHLAKVATTEQAKQQLTSDARHLKQRGLSVQKNLFDSKTGLMRPKSSSGRFDSSFDSKRWGGGYTEGSAWHHSFPPFAVAELAALHGGAASLIEKLDEMLETPGTFQFGGYGQEIHEMTEMRAVAMGQYGHNNQPSHHVLYLYALLGDHASTAEHVRHVMDRAYGVDFYAGDEDNGEMGAWFVLSALGLFAIAPGVTDEYVLGSPLFRHVVLRCPALPASAELQTSPRPARDLHVVAQGTGPGSVKVREVLWNGGRVLRPVVSDGQIQAGGVLRFVMESEPSPPAPFDPNSPTAAAAAAALSIAPPPAAGSAAGSAAASEAAAGAAAARAELEALRRSSGELAGSLKGQLDTFKGAADAAKTQLTEAKQEAEAERLARSTEGAALQKILQDQSRALRELEAKLEAAQAAAAQAASQGAAAAGAASADASHRALLEEVASLERSLAAEAKDHSRTALLLAMLDDHTKRVANLKLAQADLNSGAENDPGFGGAGPLPPRPVTSFAAQRGTAPPGRDLSSKLLLAGWGLVILAFGWALGARGGARVRLWKEDTHIV